MPINRIESGVAPAKYSHILKAIVESGAVASTASEFTVFTPPAGKIWEIKNLYLKADPPAGAASGNHSYTVYAGFEETPHGATVFMKTLYGSSVFGSSLIWDFSRWDVADLEKKPGGDEAAQNALYNTFITKNTPLSFHYFNGTNVSQTNDRKIYLSILETPLI